MKKKLSKVLKILLAVILFLAVVGSCADSGKSGTDSGNSQSQNSRDISQSINSSSEEDSDVVTDDTDNDEYVETETLAALFEYMMMSSYENYKVEYDDNFINISVWRDNIAIGRTMAKTGEKETLRAWESLVDNMTNLCDEMYGFCESAGRDDIIVTLNLLNDLNLENSLLTIVNGKVLYDSVKS